MQLSVWFLQGICHHAGVDGRLASCAVKASLKQKLDLGLMEELVWWQLQ